MDKKALIDQLKTLDTELAKGPWDKDYMYWAIRHVTRNCDYDWPEGTWDQDPGPLTPDRYDGPNIGILRNLLPMIIRQLEE